jgi:uncharacterized protein
VSRLHLFRDAQGAFEDASPSAVRVVSGTPVGEARDAYVRGHLSAGVWRCTPGAWKVSYDEWEYCHIVSGRGHLVPDDGTPQALGPGDGLVIEAGFRGVWEITETMEKHYVILLPPPGTVGAA